ncbi:MAG: response regulator [Isosphaeraceae bacterium]
MGNDAATAKAVLLVVEDSDEDFDTIREAVARSGMPIEVRRAADGDQCLELLRGDDGAAHRSIMVLLDLNIPGMDGRESLSAIKSDPRLRHVPVVVHTTSSNPRDVESCYRAGANAYHVKPIRYPEHLGSLRDLVLYWFGQVRPHLPERAER